MPTDALPDVRVRVLGPLTLAVRGEDVVVPGAKRRATLALLAVAEGATVSTTELIDALWPDDPPERATGALQSHVSRLRGHLGAASDRLTAVDHGYRLRLESGELDLDLARAGLAIARSTADDDPAGAAARLAEVRRLWRGGALADFDDVPPLVASRVVVDELRREVDALLVRCLLRAGDVDGALGASATATAADPRSEVSVRLHMEALAAAGRRADALEVAAGLRRRLREELGVDPTAELGELERAIAAGAERPGSPPAPVAVRPSGRRDLVPSSVTALIGRDAEIGAVRRLVDTERLVTVLGAGGVGKTRLAADVARRHDGEVHWVSFASLADPDDLPRALAQALGLEAARGDVLDACGHLLRAGDRLLVLDNCEHVLAHACDAIARLVRDAPALRVLATSRQRLGLPDECTFRLGPLGLPDSTSTHPERAPGLALFLDRARRARPGLTLGGDGLDAAIAIVRRLDGLPLAIELAASRLSTLDVRDMRDRLDRALDLLHGGHREPDARHRTLRATLTWSYDLLPADRQRLLRHLALFPDGIDLTTAEGVAAEVDVDGDPVSALGHLVDASLLEAEMGDGTRYRMLETLRAFGLERLRSEGDLDAAEQRLLRWAEELTTWVDATLHTPAESVADERLRRELANLRAAWASALRRGALDTAIAIIVALDDVAQWRELPEVWSWAEKLGEHPGLHEHPRRAAALATASDFAWLQGDLERATELAETALACATDDDGRGRALIAVSVVRLSQGEFRDSADLALQAAGISRIPSHSHMVAALATAYAGDAEAAAVLNVPVAPDVGITQHAHWEYTAGEIASIDGRYDDAERHYRRAIELASGVGSTFVVGIASVGLLSVLRATGATRETLTGYREVLDYWRQAGNWIQAWTTMRNLAGVLADLGDADAARALLAAADRDADSPAVGESERAPPAVEPGGSVGGPWPLVTRDDAVQFALTMIDRQLGRPPGDATDAD